MGLMRDWQPIAGVFYMPLTDEFFAGDGHWATLNGNPIRVDDTAHVDGQSFLCVTAELTGRTRSILRAELVPWAAQRLTYATWPVARR